MIQRYLIAFFAALLSVSAWAQTLTVPQQQTLKAAIVANPTWAAYPVDGDGPTDLAALLNRLASPSFLVWRTDCAVRDIYNNITWASYTPNDTPTISDTGDTLHRKTAWLLSVQVKQMNLQIMTQGRETLNTALPNIRGGLRDAVIQVPSGAGGNAVSPGGANGANVLTVCTRAATEAEKALATASSGSDTTGTVTARVMGWEGRLTAEDVRLSRLQ